VVSSIAHTGTPVFNIFDFGATGDGKTLNTLALQRAVDKCAEQGGTVVVPPGTYLTGSIELKSNVELYLQNGATILGSPQLSDYAEHRPTLKSYNDVFLKHSLFYAERQSNIAIRGSGTIDGQGGLFPVLTNEKPARYRNRPFVIRFVECSNVTVENVTLKNSAMWMQQYLACENLAIRGIRVFNHANKNNDMMDIDGCENVVISDCIGDTDDDGITLKSTSTRITHNVTITNCVISSHCNALKTGTESTGGFKNIVISNVTITPSKADSVITGKRNGICGITLTLVDGGVMDGVSISNIVMDGPEVPLFIRLGNRARVPYNGARVPGVGQMRNISISDVTAKNVKATGCAIAGLPGHALEGISLKNIRITGAGGSALNAYKPPEELEDHYPESTMWGELPAYGYFIRHVRGLSMSDVQLTYEREDTRPALVLSDITDATLSGVNAMVSPRAEAAILLDNARGVLLTGSKLRTPTSNFIKLIGSDNRNISVIGNDLTNAARLLPTPEQQEDVVYSACNRMK
jgi:polygalacturonase